MRGSTSKKVVVGLSKKTREQQRMGEGLRAKTMKRIRAMLGPETTDSARIVPRHPSPVFDCLANALIAFSFDLVKIVLGYYEHPCADTHTKAPLLLGTLPPSRVHFHGYLRALACSPNNTLWLVDSKGVLLLHPNGTVLRSTALGDIDASHLAFANCGDAYITLPDTKRIAVCQEDGQIKRLMDCQEEPWFIANKDDRLFVVDKYNRLQVCSLDNESIWTWQPPFRGVRSLAMNSHGELAICVLDSRLICQVQVWNTKGLLLRQLTAENTGTSWPCDLAVDREGNWLVCYTPPRVKVFRRDGTLLTEFGTPKDLGSPQAICVDLEGRIIVGDRGCELRVFGFM